MRKIIVFICIISVFFIMCQKQKDKNDTTGFSLLNGNSFIMKVDRVSNAPDVHFPADSLKESDYVPISENIQYNITFSADGQTLTIEPGSVSGEKTNDSSGSVFYNIVNGLFAGGRFVIWKNNSVFVAEYTKYGSGVPIIKSERGNMELIHNGRFSLISRDNHEH